MAIPAGVNQSEDPTIRAFRVTVYWLTSKVLVDFSNTMLVEVEVAKVIRFGVILDGVYVTWYSIAVVPHSVLGVAVNDFITVASVITFWEAPAT